MPRRHQLGSFTNGNLEVSRARGGSGRRRSHARRATAFAADAPGDTTAQGWSLNYTVHTSTPTTTTQASRLFSATEGGNDGAPLVGLTKSGRVNISTGLYYPSVTGFDADAPYTGTSSVTIHAPVTGIVGIPTLSASLGQLRVTCTSDAEGNATGSVSAPASVPAGMSSTPAPNTTVYLPAGSDANSYEQKVVYNEQTRLPNGQLRIVGMHTYFDVDSREIAGATAVTGDVQLGIVSCGKVTNAEQGDVPIASAGLAGGALGVGALVAGLAAVRRRRVTT
ncbi:hypothetical protein [Mobilicoccus caccae]|uniref:hypothetical protein n=1 Tax=Mobilicoccus caccae TaxID=1859295 RepID=UPI0024E15B34|nr:hypothetical protein [Mobilicoccus caccae]